MPKALDTPAMVVPQIDLRLVCAIDAEMIERIDAEINLSYTRRLIARSKRFNFAPEGPSAVHVRRWLPLCGLLLALAFTANGGLVDEGIHYDLWFAGFFAVALWAGWFLDLDRSAEFLPLYRMLARTYTRSFFKTARKRVPFTAEYEFRGDPVVYYRISGGKTEVVWHSRVHGLSLSGEGYTLRYKNARTLVPHALFLHQPSDDFTTVLARCGVTPLP